MIRWSLLCVSVMLCDQLLAQRGGDRQPTLARIDGSLLEEYSLRVVSDGARRCIGADVGRSVVLTSFHCLEPYWGTKAASEKVKFGLAKWASLNLFPHSWIRTHLTDQTHSVPLAVLLETTGHTMMYLTVRDLDTDAMLDRRRFTLVGFSAHITNDVVVQSGCGLVRVDQHIYRSSCGNGFDASGILVLEVGESRPVVYGLAAVEPSRLKQTAYTLKVASESSFGSKLKQLRTAESSVLDRGSEHSEPPSLNSPASVSNPVLGRCNISPNYVDSVIPGHPGGVVGLRRWRGFPLTLAVDVSTVPADLRTVYERAASVGVNVWRLATGGRVGSFRRAALSGAQIRVTVVPFGSAGAPGVTEIDVEGGVISSARIQVMRLGNDESRPDDNYQTELMHRVANRIGHEIGHALGVGMHSPDEMDLMFEDGNWHRVGNDIERFVTGADRNTLLHAYCK